MLSAKTLIKHAKQHNRKPGDYMVERPDGKVVKLPTMAE